MQDAIPIMNQDVRPRVSMGDLDLTPLKVTALTYLREALVKEDYENMDELVRYARVFGADEQEVAQTLQPLR